MAKRPKRKLIHQYVIDIFADLGLGGWGIRVTVDKHANRLADVRWWPMQKRALVRVGREFFETTWDEQRETIVHEGLHLAFCRETDVVESDLKHSKIMKKGEFALLFRVRRRQHELAAEQLSKAIAPRFPLPPWADD